MPPPMQSPTRYTKLFSEKYSLFSKLLSNLQKENLVLWEGYILKRNHLFHFCKTEGKEKDLNVIKLLPDSHGENLIVNTKHPSAYCFQISQPCLFYYLHYNIITSFTGKWKICQRGLIWLRIATFKLNGILKWQSMSHLYGGNILLLDENGPILFLTLDMIYLNVNIVSPDKHLSYSLPILCWTDYCTRVKVQEMYLIYTKCLYW